MPSSQDIILAFDLYGTLLSTESIANKLASHFGQEKATSLAATWRKYQLEYTWRLNSMGQYEDFSELTRRSLLHTLQENSLSLDEKSIDDLMKAYDSLSTFPDVEPGLTEVAKTPGIHAVVFSNGTAEMVSNSVKRSPDLAPHATLFKDLVVVGETKKFKPDPAVYRMLARKLGKEDAMQEIWLVSGNPFDVVGARSAGMSAAWVDRAGNGWADGLVEGERGRPTIIVKGLDDLVQAVKTHSER